MDRLAEFFNQLGFELLISEVESIASKHKFPNFLDFKIVSNTFPIIVDFLNKLKIRFQHAYHDTQINRIVLDVFPKFHIPTL